MCLRFVFILATRLAAWLRLSRREETWKTAEILILRHQLAVLQRRQPRRPKLNWADRALLAALLGVIPKARRHGLRLLVTPDTILRWHRDIVRHRRAARSMRGKTRRPATRQNIRALILRPARENPEWGYRRIHGELAGLGVRVSASTVWEILKANGIDPAPRRTGPTSREYGKLQPEFTIMFSGAAPAGIGPRMSRGGGTAGQHAGHVTMAGQRSSQAGRDLEQSPPLAELRCILTRDTPRPPDRDQTRQARTRPAPHLPFSRTPCRSAGTSPGDAFVPCTAIGRPAVASATPVITIRNRNPTATENRRPPARQRDQALLHGIGRPRHGRRCPHAACRGDIPFRPRLPVHFLSIR
jgi:transposase